MVQTVSTYSPEWQALRKHNVGASEVAALCNLDPWKDSGTVWESKHTNTVLQPPHGVNTRVWWGHEEEASIINATVFERWGANSEKIVHTGTSFYDHELMVSPDAVVLDEPAWVERMPERRPSLIEAKTVGESVAPKWKDGPPIYVLLQGYAQMEMMKAVDVAIGARIAGAPVKVWVYESDAGIQGAIRQIVQRFWKTDTKPADWDEWVHDLLTEVGLIKPPKQLKTVKLDRIEHMSLLSEWAAAKRALAAAKKEAEQLKDELAELFGDQYDAIADFEGNVAVLAEKRERANVDTKSLFEDYPGLQELYTDKTEYVQYTIAKGGPLDG